MKHTLLFVFFLLISSSIALAQPDNDECSTAIDLGAVPACQPDMVFTNVAATESNIGAANNPTCFVGGLTRRDVWFAFTSTAAIENYVISLQGVTNGPNQQSIQNPQITVYRGICNGLSELLCISAPNNTSNLELPIFNLVPNLTYYIRVNDYTATATPNAGDFTLCVDEYVPEVIMGETDFTEACSGTLFDSGGPDERYGNNEDLTFTICPQQQSSCIQIDVVDFDIEFGYDLLTIYEGDDINGPIIARVTGINAGNIFPIQSSSGCVTIRFESDLFIRGAGFELNWQCASAACLPTSLDDPTVIPSIPFNGSFSTCDVAASFGTSPCGDEIFLNGPEHVFTYESDGDECIEINVSGAALGTGVLVLDGPPTDTSSNCVAINENGFLRIARLREAGTYYIVVANAALCTNFDIAIQTTDCALAPGLVDALCNPLNGCAGDEPSIFIFQDGFQDIEITEDNRGCWLGFGSEPDFYWFTMEAQASGRFGFILESADEASDIDFNVWGPFQQDEVCTNKQEVINFIENNQPIRSSWSPTAGRTGLANTHPIFGTPIQDTYDCGGPNSPGDGGDDFVRTIDAREGEVYVVLINDWGNQIQNDGIAVDWSPSDMSVISMVNTEIVVGDTAICEGDSVQIVLESGIENIRWFPSESLTCDDCPNPIAFPTETTTYTAIVEGICTVDTARVEVQVFSLEAGPDRTVCLGEDFELQAGVNFDDATYEWIIPSGISFSCTDCPNPTVTATTAGTFEVVVNLDAPTCPLSDMVRITVLPQQAPQFSVSDSLSICVGETVELGSDNNPGNQTYTWTSRPAGFTSAAPNPTATPTVSTKYFVSVMNNTCPSPSTDSVFVQVATRPQLQVSRDTMLCLGDSLRLGVNTVEPNTEYLWTGPGRIDDTTDPNTSAVPQFSGLYVLTATRGACTESASFEVDVTQISVDITNGDTVRVCKGDEVVLTADFTPDSVQPIWSPNDGNLSDTIGAEVILTPIRRRMYFATVTVDACVRMDSVLVIVDSLPPDLAIMPMDTTVCEGSMVEMTSVIYEPSEFPDIEFLWEPPVYQQTPDSLYNMVVQPLDTIEYSRLTINGACRDTALATINVQPIPIIMVTPSDTTVCPGESVRLMATSDEEIETWMWMPEQGLSSTENPNVTATPFSSVTYTVMGETENGCPGNASATINVVPDPMITITPDNPIICLGDEIGISARILPAGLDFQWTSADDPNFGTVITPNITVSPTQTSTYTLTVDNGECGVFTRDVIVTVVGEEDLTLTASATTVCSGNPVTFTATGTADGTFVWSPSGQTDQGTTATFTQTFNTPGEQQISVTYTYGPGCGEITETITVTVLDQILIDSVVAFLDNVPVDTIELGDEIEVEVFTIPTDLSGFGNVTYTWTENGNTVGGNSRSITVVPQESGLVTYDVTITTEAGCTVSGQVTIFVKPADLQFPNAFYPDSQTEENKTFRIFYSGNYQLENIKIYNRWGQVVFESSDINFRWDGTKDGNELPSDVYVYVANIILPTGEMQVFRGEVLLLR